MGRQTNRSTGMKNAQGLSKRDSILRQVYQGCEIEFQGVKFVVKRLPAIKQPLITDAILRVWRVFSTSKFDEKAISDVITDVAVILDQCIEIPELGDEHISTAELPADLLWELLKAFFEHSFSLGKLQALVQEALGGLGLKDIAESLIQGIKSDLLSGNLKKTSEET